MSLLVCDIGNTSIKFSLESDGKLGRTDIISHNDFSNSVLSKLSFTNVAISSVVPERTKKLTELLKTQYDIEPFILSKSSKFSINIDYKSLETLGIDRICGAEGAYNFYINKIADKIPKDTKLIIVDCGTATTINIVESPCTFTGGIIAPGLITMSESLHSGTAQLPLVDLTNYEMIIGKDTMSCIISGVINATLGLIEKVVNHFSGNDFNCEIFLTGGNSHIIKEHLSKARHIENLVMHGIASVYKNESAE